MPGNRGLHPRLQVGDRVAVRLFFSGESRQQTPIVISPEIQFWIDHKNEAQKALEAMQWFRSGSITEKTDEELTVISSILATLPVPNPEMRHTPIIQAMAINHIQMLRYIQTSDAEAKKLSEQNLKVSETNLEVSQKLHRLTTIATVAAVACYTRRYYSGCQRHCAILPSSVIGAAKAK
jgi:hypothetical protein